MSDAPERLWIHKTIRQGRFCWFERLHDGDVEYIRADLYTAIGTCGRFCEACARLQDRIEELEAEVEELSMEMKVREAIDDTGE